LEDQWCDFVDLMDYSSICAWHNLL